MITDHEKRVIAWHEAGHALVSELLPTVDEVQKVSIVPRGKALGYTLNLPQEDRYLKSRQELIDYMKVLLAGPRRRADHLRPGHDRRLRRPPEGHLDRALDGLRLRDGHDDPLPPGPRRRLNVSEAMRQSATRRSQAIAEEAYRGAHRLITDHRDLLDEIAERLLADEVDRARRDPRDHGRASTVTTATAATRGPGTGTGTG